MMWYIFLLWCCLCLCCANRHGQATGAGKNESYLMSNVLVRGDLNLSINLPHILIVTYAQGEPYLTTQRQIVSAAKASSHYIYSWNLDTLSILFPQHNSVWNNEGNGRPACVAMKAFVVELAMRHANPNDWIIWVDSSRWYLDGVLERYDVFVQRLIQSGLDAYPGTALCGLTNIDNGPLVSRETFRALGADRPKYWFAPHFQNNFFAFSKNQRTIGFMEDWKAYSMDLKINCASIVPDQAPFAVLVTKYSFPIVNLCTGPNMPHFHDLKNIDFILSQDVIHVISDYDKFQQALSLDWDQECQIKGRDWYQP